MADTDFTLPQNLYNEIYDADCISQTNCNAMEGMAKAISRLTTDSSIKAMADHIAYLAFDTMNVVNCAAEELGENFNPRLGKSPANSQVSVTTKQHMIEGSIMTEPLAIKSNTVFCRLETTRKELNSAWDHFIEIDSMTKAVMALIEKADDSDQSIIAARSVLSHICQLCEEYADEVDTAEVEVLKLQKEASHA